MMNKKRTFIQRIVYSGFFIGLGTILAAVFHAAGLGALLSPLHLTVLLAGLLLGWPYGLAVGIASPLVNCLMLGMPPLFPTATSMVFELGTYGFLSGLLYNKLHLTKNDIANIYLSLIIAMIAGRIVYGVFQGIYAGITNSEYSLAIWFSAIALKVWPAIVVQILVIPPLVYLLKPRLKEDSNNDI